nr:MULTISPECIES: discoidin domain-containing protein [Actinoalloteichus]
MVAISPGSAEAAPVLLSQGQPATASSAESEGMAASAAVDGDPGTRWSSTFSDPQWLQVDLGTSATLDQVVLDWETAHATAFQLQVSPDGAAWTTIYETTTGSGGRQTLDVAGTGRHVRMLGTQRAGGYGYSLWEFQVYGTADTAQPPEDPRRVEVTGTHGDWQLTVDGSPYQVRGLTWGPSIADASTYLPDLRSMGVNTIRTWGTDGSTLPLLDAAAAEDVTVINGFWLQPGGGPGSGGCVDYVTDTGYKSDMLAEMVRWVTAYREHPGVLMWNVGNESLLGLQNCFSGAELERQRVAYAQYVNEATLAIQAVDPDHPVTSTDAWTGAWAYLEEHAPALDLFAVNAYDAVCGIEQAWLDGGHTKPYILTEGGPAGEWEVVDDANGVPQEPTDLEKRAGYTEAWDCLTGHEGVALGGTLFHYGLEEDFGGVWFNLLPGGQKRLSYDAVVEAYGGTPRANTPPVITDLRLSRTQDVPAGGTFTVAVDVSDPDGDPIAYDIRFNAKYIDGSGALVPADFTGSGPFTVTAPQQLGVWKVYVVAEDGQGNVGIETRSFRVVPPTVPGENVALGRPTTASTFQEVGDGAPYFPWLATDGDLGTRWASDWSDPQWIQVDLGESREIRHVQLVWETAYGREYRIEVSEDGTSWTTLHSTTTGDGGVDGIDVDGSGRYVRLTGTGRGTGWGYALYEMGVYSP